MAESPHEDNLFRLLFNAVPLPLLRVTREIGILDLNAAAQELYKSSPSQALRIRGGDLLHCINAVTSPGGCGKAKACSDCLIRNSVQRVLDTGQEISRLRVKTETVHETKREALELLLNVTPIHFLGETSALLCIEDISELTSLRSLLPICASCKKIRDDQQLWRSLESYLSRFHELDHPWHLPRLRPTALSRPLSSRQKLTGSKNQVPYGYRDLAGL